MQNLEIATPTPATTPNLNALLSEPADNHFELSTPINADDEPAVENGFAALGLTHSILRSIEKSGYTTPTPIQAQAIPAAMAGRDLLLSAQTGSGKTAAFVLPILHHIANNKSRIRSTRALILTPTRELAYQVADSIRNYGSNLKDIFCVPLVGGAPYTGQIRALKKGVQIIVATPGRLLDHMNDGRIDFSSLSMLVLDEADRMLDMGFADDISRILEAMPSERQTIMSSATWDGPVGKIAASFTKDPERISIKVESAHIDEKVYFCDDFNHKNKLLDELICEKDMQQSIIFTATKRSSEQLAERLSDAGHKACYLHGDLPQSKRNRIVADLKDGRYDILVATDVAARGIDLPKISHVFNYDLPRQVEDYVHRIGRSGRAGRTGTAINLCSRDDRSQYHAINRYLKRDMTEATVEGLEPRFIESSYDRSGKGKRSGGRSNSQNRGRNGNGGREKYSGFKGDANKSGFGRDAGQKDSFKPRGERSIQHSGQPQHHHDDHAKLLTSHEFNFFNETRKGRDDQPARKSAHAYENKPARKNRQPHETHFNTGGSFNKDATKSKRFQVETTGSNSPRNSKSHNSKGFEGRQYEKTRKQSEDRPSNAGSQERPRFAKSGQGEYKQGGYKAEGFKKSGLQKSTGANGKFAGQKNRDFHESSNRSPRNSDGQQAVKRSGKFAERRSSPGKPV